MDFDAVRQCFVDLIDKPPLTDKLLSRPPFKFLVDVFTNTINKTGFLKDKFSSDEHSESVLSDKNAKVAFLEKWIGLVNTDGSLSDVKASKIVAGKEPELTLKLLKKFANEARQHRDGSAGSNKENKKKEKSSSKERKRESSKEAKPKEDRSKSKDSSKESRSKSSDRTKSKEKDEKKKDKDKDRSKSKERDRDKKSKSSSSSKSDKDKSEKKERKTKVKDRDTANENPSPSTRRRRSSVGAESSMIVAKQTMPESTQFLDSHDDDASGTAKTEDSGLGDMGSLSPRPPPPMAREQQRIGTSAGRPQTSMGRPGTSAARAAPPKLKKKQIAEIEEKPQVQEPTAEIFSENSATARIDDDFLIEEQAELPPANVPQDLDPNAEHGGLVAKIMETRDQLEEGQIKPDFDEQDDGEVARQKQQTENLQKSLQRVTQTAYPFAKLFDFAQEDLDSMLKELEKWRNETRKNEQLLKERDAQGQGEAQMYAAQLAQLEDSLRETRQQLQAVKSKLNSNEEQLRVLLANL